MFESSPRRVVPVLARLGPLRQHAAEEATPGIAFEAVPFSWWVAISSTILGVASFAFGWWLYTRRQTPSEEDAIQRFQVIGRPFFTILYNKYYFDEIYRGLLIYPTVALASLCAKFDYEWVINRLVDLVGSLTRLVADGIGVFDQVAIDGYFVNGIPGLFNKFGAQLRLLQTGRVQNYLLILIIGLLILVGISLMVWSGQVPSLAALPGP